MILKYQKDFKPWFINQLLIKHSFNTINMQNHNIDKLIYKAQTIGNIEPIEYMTPYPSTQALIEGQNIKYGKHIIYNDYNISNYDFYELIQQTAHWVKKHNIRPKDNVIVQELKFPQTQLLLFGIWHLGAVGVILENRNLNIDKSLSIKSIPKTNNLFETVSSYPKRYNPEDKALLRDIAILIINNKKTISLSHYSLLINTNSIQKSLNLNAGKKVFCNLKPISSSWVIFSALLPIYAGLSFTKVKPDIIITFDTINKKNGFQLRNDWENFNDFKSHHIGICSENTAAFCVWKEAIHLTQFDIKNQEIWIKGHSVMNGYLNKIQDQSSFDNDYMIIKK